MPTGLTKEDGWQVAVAKTFPMDIEDVWDFVMSPEAVAIWLGEAVKVPGRGKPLSTKGGSGTVTMNRTADRLRLAWTTTGADHETTIEVVVSGGADTTSLKFHQEHMTSESERFTQRDHWTKVLNELETALGF